jgi:hypothetical protein
MVEIELRSGVRIVVSCGKTTIPWQLDFADTLLAAELETGAV